MADAGLSGPRELELDLGYVTVAAKAWGEDRDPPVLAVHGWLDNANSFDALAQHMSGLQLVALDTVGHGRSGHRAPGAYYHLIDHVTDLINVADVLGWRQFSLLGHSMGGVLSTLLAGALPDRVKHLVLIESLGPYTNKDEEAPAQLAKSIAQMHELREKTMPHYASVDEAVQARMKGWGMISEGAARKLVERGLVRDRDGYTWCSDPRLRLASGMRLTEKMVAAYLRAITAPTLLLIGDNSYFPQYQQHADRQQHVASLAVREFVGGHHLHMEEAAGEMAPLIEHFLLTGEAGS